MADPYDPTVMRKELDSLLLEIKKIEERSRPLREKYDGISQKAEADLKNLAVQFKDIEAPLTEMKRRVSILARALSGRVVEG